VRELLQNAFDAVREQIAYQRLAKSTTADSAVGRLLGKLNEVELRVETISKNTWLVCKDSGVGMTKAIIGNHLLVSGTAKRHDILELERQCNQAGFALERTGEFGIGVLSYFMIADRLIIKTRRSQESSNSEHCGWQFETEGVGSFGELRRDNIFSKGTEVWLHMRSTIMGDEMGTIFASRDGISWTRSNTQFTDHIFGISYAKGTFTAVGENGRIMSSDDGLNWVQHYSGTTEYLSAVTYGDGKYVAVGAYGTIITSPDSLKWTTVSSGSQSWLGAVVQARKKFIAIGTDGTILTSRDGLKWSPEL
jgi:hypothetical protein